MIALGLIFIIIIALLVVVIYLLKQFFDAYEHIRITQIHSAETLEDKNEISQLCEEIDLLVQKQSDALEAHFSTFHENEEKLPPKNADLLKSLKAYMLSILKLLKAK